MVELLGILLAALVLWAGMGVWRAARALVRLLGRWRPGHGRPQHPAERRLRVSRATRRAQDARLAALTAELARTRATLRVLERERALRAAGVAGWQERFLRLKRAFAQHFHPDRLRGHPEARVRRRIFAEFWDVLRRIERS